MAAPTTSKRFALLIGVDFYQRGESRQTQESQPVSLQNLKGCVNDVRDIEGFLATRFGLNDPYVLTSSPSSKPNIPQELSQKLPTYKNIKESFAKIYEDAHPGDLFFFYFSGHGARLRPIGASPAGRQTDPSLMPMDYCCGQPAVRGWELNNWLRRLYGKKVQIIVCLDSCYSGGSWRDGVIIRTPDNWEPPPNLPVDEISETEHAETHGTFCESNSRDSDLDESWDINPTDFTLMAACKRNQTAEERPIDGQMRGVFTYYLVSYLRQNLGKMVAYRTVCDHIQNQVNAQAPQVYGQDRLAFFSNKEPRSPVPIIVRVEEKDAVLPIGRLHGVKVGAEFTTYPQPLNAPLSIYQVDELKCRARIGQELSSNLCNNSEVYSSRWSADETVKIGVDQSLGCEFRKLLHVALQNRIAGRIEVSEGPEVGSFMLRKRGHDGVDVIGPKSLVGYDGVVHGLDIHDQHPEKLATKSALALAHLFRFQQVLDLRIEASKEPAPFKLILEHDTSRKQLLSGDKAQDNTRLRLSYENRGDTTLFFMFLVLSPGFHVRQLYPRIDSPQVMQAQCKGSFTFKLRVPSRLPDGCHRDIIRAVITNRADVSLKTLELPDIWDTDQNSGEDTYGPERHATMISDLTWWVEDIEIWTERLVPAGESHGSRHTGFKML
ncbi:hypothetical protein DL770_010520 [Monosporascus sp. CRB-9-2]|nr:hypothetical protein DL770_010520 [Monosporascus sp. CRB-9-2]